MANMRAKVYVASVTRNMTGGDTFSSEQLTMYPLSRSTAYPPDGSDEDNTYAKFSPSGKFELLVANPALLGKFKPGSRYYVDFTEIDPEPAKEQAANAATEQA